MVQFSDAIWNLDYSDPIFEQWLETHTTVDVGFKWHLNARPEFGWSTYSHDHLPLEFQTPTASGCWESDIRIPFVDYSSVCVCVWYVYELVGTAFSSCSSTKRRQFWSKRVFWGFWKFFKSYVVSHYGRENGPKSITGKLSINYRSLLSRIFLFQVLTWQNVKEFGQFV